jgi:hypothetical protein
MIKMILLALGMVIRIFAVVVFRDLIDGVD